MDGDQSHQIRKKRKLIIGSEDEEEPEQQQPSVKLPATASESKVETSHKDESTAHSSKVSSQHGSHAEQQAHSAAQSASKNGKKDEGSSISASSAGASQPKQLTLADSLNNNSKKSEKIARKTQEQSQKTEQQQQQQPQDQYEPHESDNDLFQPDDSNTADINAIYEKYNWKKRVPPTQPAPKQEQQLLTKRPVERSPAKPISKAPAPSSNTSSSRSREEIVRKPKDALIYDVLKRWWYALPDWPPANYDYQPSLEANKLRLISKQKFRIAPDLDDKGYAKCYEILGYEGVFKDFNNKQYDLRPLENKPCYTEFAKKETGELIGLLKTALKNQIEALEGSKVIDENLHVLLKKHYAKVKDR